MDFEEKYSKYKKKYKKLKRLQSANKFIYFDMSDQNEYIEGNIARLISLSLKCFPFNGRYSGIEREIEYILLLRDLIFNNRDKQFYFLLDDEGIIISYCWLTNDKVFFVSDNNVPSVETYVYIQNGNKSMFNEEMYIGPTIISLCRDPLFRGAGKILLDFICSDLKTKGFERVYLLPESGRYKRNYDSLACNSYKCPPVDKENYKKSTMELIEYYKKIGFVVNRNLYGLDPCDCNVVDSAYVLLNVMEKNLI